MLILLINVSTPDQMSLLSNVEEVMATCCMMCWVSIVISWGLGTLAAWFRSEMIHFISYEALTTAGSG